VFSREIALPYPPEITIERNLTWIALALFCAPAILFRVSVRLALLSSALVLFASLGLDILLASRIGHIALSDGFAFDIAARSLAAVGCLIGLITYEGDRWPPITTRSTRTITFWLGLVSIANLGFDVPLYFSALADSFPGLFATVLATRLITTGLIFEFALFYGRQHRSKKLSNG